MPRCRGSHSGRARRLQGMTIYSVAVLDDEVAAGVRASLTAPDYGHPAHAEVADDNAPCRVCLGRSSRGGRRLLFTLHDPFRGDTFPLPGTDLHPRGRLHAAPGGRAAARDDRRSPGDARGVRRGRGRSSASTASTARTRSRRRAERAARRRTPSTTCTSVRRRPAASSAGSIAQPDQVAEPPVAGDARVARRPRSAPPTPARIARIGERAVEVAAAGRARSRAIAAISAVEPRDLARRRAGPVVPGQHVR